MPYWRLFYHLIWATKDRAPLIPLEVWPELERLLRLTAHKNQLIVHGVGGVADHVHLAVSIPPALSVSSAVGRLKGSSSRMLSQHLAHGFGWQAEYGVVSFAERHLPPVLAYITDQPRHHANNTLWSALEHLPEPSNNPPSPERLPHPPAPT
jgi:putative transposase